MKPTAVPEATVDEDCDAHAREHDVRATAVVHNGSTVDAESQALSVEG